MSAIKVLEKFMSQQHPKTTFKFDGAVIETIGPAMTTLHILLKKYPQVEGQLDKIEVVPATKLEGEWVAAVEDGHYLMLNEKYYGSLFALEQARRSDEGVGWHYKGSRDIRSNVAHEFGHMLSFYLHEKYPVEMAHFKIETDIQPQVSGYARSFKTDLWRQMEEGFAEGFAAQYFGTDEVKALPYVAAQKTFLEAVF